VDKKDLLQLSKELSSIAEKARDRKISLEDMQGGTFTISNQGAFGGAHFTPIVNKPEAAILGLGKGALQPVVTKDKKIEARMVLPMTISYDHRIIDGGSAARFMVDLVSAFENFGEADLQIKG
jgi:pyruvate dehydrogenase E2 component (dihydrolipoamide acetyltransferase)